MTGRTVAIALGTGFTTALLVAVSVIEALPYEFSAIIGLPVGLVAGVAVAVLVGWRYERASPAVRSVAGGAAGFGYAVVSLLAVRYADFLGLESAITFERLVVASAVVGVAALVVSWLHASRPSS
ncbi:hypothetical protein [Halapricum desulfuricans]|uniref:DUF8147 domain-containing protein n=1 Tax=Halapricum desulfuricans TaxID=2841257 RepID=A0A897N887_9EURY|nr:hypothetical protein [Halapricum desulfuricans]QSG07383.1 hypothetical protein HSR121_3073 [Halapricum desulfuricans]